MNNVNEPAVAVQQEPPPRRGIDPDGQGPAQQDSDMNNVDHHHPNVVVELPPLLRSLLPQTSMLRPDASRMTLSDTERQWALAIKEAVLEDPELEPLSDFEIVQVALIDQDNMEEALERIYKLQAFQQEYDCVSSCVEAHGQDAIQRCMDLFPGLLLSVSYQASLGNHVFASDLTKLYRSIVESSSSSSSSSSSEDMTAVVLVACYVVFQATNPDFESMRQGVVLLAECGGFCWTKNFKLSLFQKFWVELGGVYPMKLKKLRHFHTSMFFNLLQSMGRPFLPKDVKEAFEIGCCSVLGRLDNVYLSPSVAAANARFKRRIKVCLQTRQENASSFKL